MGENPFSTPGETMKVRLIVGPACITLCLILYHNPCYIKKGEVF